MSSIGESAFYENATLSSIIFADGTSISSIGNFAFYGCDGLSNVDVPATTTTIGEGAF